VSTDAKFFSWNAPNSISAWVPPQTPQLGVWRIAVISFSDPSACGEGAGYPLPKNPTRAAGPSALRASILVVRFWKFLLNALAIYIFIQRFFFWNSVNVASILNPVVCFVFSANNDSRLITISCAGGRHNMPPPLQVDLWPFDLESSVPSHVWRGLPVCQY